MTTILIVDSSCKARCELVDQLDRLCRDWSILQAEDGQQALSILADCTESADIPSVDIVITESKLTDMDALTLLERVRTVSPSAIRFTLSADSTAEVLLENTQTNQRFLLKPINPRFLVTTIERSLQLRETLADQRLRDYMGSIKSVPSLPAIYDEMTTELASPHSSLLKVGSIVERDTGLTITVLKIVNSAFYGLNRRVESVGQAVTLLGVHMIKNVTLTTKVFSRFTGSPVSTRRLTELNDEALRIGALSNQFSRLAKLPRSSVDHCQISGMMANVGELIATVNTDGDSEGLPLNVDLLGASLLNLWMMPETVVEAVARQHDSLPRTMGIISPLIVLHSIRYLQANFTDTTDEQQRSEILAYLSGFMQEKIAEDWIEAYQAIEQLTASTTSRAA